MNIIFGLLSLASICMLIFTDPNSVLSSMITGASSAVTLAVTMLAIYCVWLSVLKLMEATGIDRKITRLCMPLTRRLFKGESDETYQYIAVNLSANLLGMGGASTPMGIKAVNSMRREGKKATDNMILFAVINCTSIQLLPATIIGMRLAAGSVSPADIILPSLIATTCSTLIGLILCKVFSRR